MKFPTRSLSVAAGVVALASLAACAPYQTYPSAGYPSGGYPAGGYPTASYPSQPVYSQPGYPQYASTYYGQVTNIEAFQTEQARTPSGLGAVGGGVLGGVVGNQIGGGSGRALATLAGVFGGALAGNAIEGNQRGPVVQTFRITVRLDNNGTQAFDVPNPGDLRVGDRVSVQNGQLRRI